MQPPFDQIEGIISTSVGYASGKEENPTDEQGCAGTTGHHLFLALRRRIEAGVTSTSSSSSMYSMACSRVN